MGRLYNPDDYTFIFLSNKMFTFDTYFGFGISGDGSWKIIYDKFSFKLIIGGESKIDIYDYSFSSNDKTLILKDEKG